MQQDDVFSKVKDYLTTVFLLSHYFLGGAILLTYQTLLEAFGERPQLNKTYEFHSFVQHWCWGLNPFWSRQVFYSTPKEELNSKPRLYVSNHTSYADFMLVAGAGLNNIGVARGDLLKLPIAGPVFKNAGMLPVHFIRKPDGRWGTVAEKTKEMMDRAQKYMSEDISVLVMPEGKAHIGDDLSDFKPGMFKLAKDIDVVPMATSGAAALWPMVREGVPGFRFGRGNAILSVGDPMEPLECKEMKTINGEEKFFDMVEKKYFVKFGDSDWEEYLRPQIEEGLEKIIKLNEIESFDEDYENIVFKYFLLHVLELWLR